MSWRDNLRQGSFRDVPFQWIDDAAQGGGRRGPDHQFPLRDTPYAEDLGRQAETFTLNVVTIGANEDDDRKALRAACAKAGPGKLVHPLWGEMTVMCRGCNFRVSTSKLGVSYFVLTFSEAGSQANAATVSASTPAQTTATAANAQGANQGNFGNSFAALPAGGPVALSGQSDSSSILGTVSSVAMTIRSDARAAFAVASQISAAIGSVASLVAAPLQLAGAITGIVRAVSILTAPPPGPVRKALIGTLDPADPSSAIPSAILAQLDDPVTGVSNDDPDEDTIAAILKAFTTLSTVDPSYELVQSAPPPVTLWTPPPQATPTLQAQFDNRAALLALTRRAALACACQAATARSFPSYQDAIATRDDLAARLALEIFAADDEASFNALRALRNATIRDITARAASLPQLVTLTPAATLPALLLAFKLYDDPEREDEIIARNDIAFPAFVPGGQPLLVLNA
ncbi:MAG TPA: DNA circularization N-terminal domain-containing protein [Stellaceae bacterium]|jgi:prophage DNA circulation protein